MGHCKCHTSERISLWVSRRGLELSNYSAKRNKSSPGTQSGVKAGTDHWNKAVHWLCILLHDQELRQQQPSQLLNPPVLSWTSLLLLLLSRFSSVQLCGPHRRQPTRLPRSWDSPGKNTGVGCHFKSSLRSDLFPEAQAGKGCAC